MSSISGSCSECRAAPQLHQKLSRKWKRKHIMVLRNLFISIRRRDPSNSDERDRTESRLPKSPSLKVSQTRPSSHVLGNTPDVRHIKDDDEPCASPPLRQRKIQSQRWTSKEWSPGGSKGFGCTRRLSRPTSLLLAHLLFADSSPSLLFCLHRRHFGTPSSSRRIYAPFFFRRQKTEPRAECSRPDTY
jgi:hypothetical protein